MKKPKLSIITVNLNNEDGLEKTIKSVIEQTFTDYEFIVIDGGSSDDSRNIIKKYEKNISYWESKKDNGVYCAMNKGIDVAKGEYLQFLNSGDYFLNGSILKKAFKSGGNKDIYYGSSIRKAENGKRYKISEPKILTFKRFFDYSICHQSMFIKKTLFDKFGKYNENLKIVSDWEFNVKAIILNNCTLKFLDFPIVFYDMNGISSKRQLSSLKEKDDAAKRLIPHRILLDYRNQLFDLNQDTCDLENKIEILSRDLSVIQSSKFYKVWQYMNFFLKRIGLKKTKIRKTEEPLVTIITVIFNPIKAGRENQLLQCLESVKNQKYKNIEHLIIDGGSSDGTIELLKNYQVNNSIRLISEPDNGIYEAMNKGVKLARGKYVAFLNSDDFYHDEKGIALSVSELEFNDAIFSYSPVINFDEKNKKQFLITPNISKVFFSIVPNHQTMLMRRDIIIKENYFNTNYKCVADYDLILRICLKGYKSVFINTDFVTYRTGGFSFHANKDGSVIKEVAKIYFNNYKKISKISMQQCKNISQSLYSGSESSLPIDLALQLKPLAQYFDYKKYIKNKK